MSNVAAGKSTNRSRAVLVAIAATLTAVLAGLASGGAPAAAKPAAGTPVQVAKTVSRSCFAKIIDGPGVTSYETTSPSAGYLHASLAADEGDWDLAIFDAVSGKAVAAGSSRSAEEVASGWTLEGQKLVVQACRISGDAATALVDLEVDPVDLGSVEAPSLVEVKVANRAEDEQLQGLGLDLTEHRTSDGIAAVLHGDEDERTLERAGFEFEPLVANLTRQSLQARREDRAYARSTEQSKLPSGQTTYRQLADYQQDLKDLADDNLDLVRPITLANETYEGRTVEGIEITTDPNQVRDGKPVYLHMGLHHAREWPSGEHAIEWAYELINGYRSGDADLKPLVEQTRTIVIPVVNPDGFNASRAAGQLNGHGNGQGGDALVNFVTSPGEYRRKNCRTPGMDSGLCPPSGSVGAAETGVDPNRNYGGFWGGPGASDQPQAADYRGPGPFSEPETQNIRELVSERAVVMLITNHTFSNLVLRPPGIASLGDTVDEDLLRQLGASFTAENGYLNQKGFELYDTSGTTEDWTYSVTGGLGYTFEIGCDQGDNGASFDPEGDCPGAFHPPYELTVNEYEGNGPAATNVGGGGNRAAYLIAQQTTADPARHSVLSGSAPAGATLRVDRDVATPTWEGRSGGEVDNPGPPFLDDHLSSEMKVPADGEFELNINPSTSPFAAQDTGRTADGGPPQDDIAFSGDPSGPPADGAAPGGDFESTNPANWNDHPFEIDATSDNEAATIQIEWATPSSDWDMKVFRDTDGDGSSEGEPASAQVGNSAQGPSTEESTTIVSPETATGKLEPGKYVIRVVNFAAIEPYTGTISFEGPQPFEPGITQAWTFSCELDGQVRFTDEVTIARGESQSFDLTRSCGGDPSVGGGGGVGGGGASGDGSASGGGGGTPLSRRCKLSAPKLIAGTNKGETLRGTDRDDAIFGRGGRDRLVGQKGDDCLFGGGDRDILRGKAGDDQLFGGGGGDSIKGNAGNDDVRGGGSNDRIRTAGGSDIVRGSGGRDTLNTGGGDDTAKGGSGNDKVRGGGGDDELRGNGGNDVLRGGGGSNTFKCGRGKDTVIGAGRGDEVAPDCERVKR